MRNKNVNNIFVCATEQSGDNLGEKILKQLNLLSNNYRFDGVGGNKMNKFLLKKFYRISDFKSMGIIEILGSINKYLKMINILSNIVIKNKYKIVITIDSPDFNYRLAKKIREKGFEGNIIHIVAPTVWAWRKNRAKSFSNIYNKLLVLFPFEKKFFQKHKLNTKYIGHPIYYIKNKKNLKKNYIAFLPGSREGEVITLIKYFRYVSDFLYNNHKNYKIFIPTLPHLKKIIYIQTKNWKNRPKIITNNILIEKFYSSTYFAIVCSGTASLEISKRKIPQIVVYKMNYITEIILKKLVYIKFANIINIMANKIIIPEITNSNLTKNNLIDCFKEVFNKNSQQILKSKKYINKLILKKSPDKIAANEIHNLLFPKPIKN